MSSQKRTHEELDPDYADVSEQQAKRQRALEQDAKQAVEKRIQNILKTEFQREISNKETELNQVDRRLNEARLMMDRLRACIVANYYGQMNHPTSSQASSVNAPPPSIHPAVKKYLGKKPAHTIFDSTSSQSQSEMDRKIDGGLLASQSQGESNKVSNSSHGHLVTGKSHEETKKIHKSLSVSQNSSSSLPGSRSSTPPVRVPQGLTSDAATYDDRRSRFKIKKKIIVGNVSKYIPVDHRESNDMSSHKWMVYVRGPKSDPDISGFVKKVWFFLHHSYKPNDLVEISSPPFHLTRRGWGEFPVRVQLHFLDPRNKKVDIIHHLKLDKTFTGLQTLGAETVVEVELERDFFESGNFIESSTAARHMSSSPHPALIQHKISLPTSTISSPTVSIPDLKTKNEKISSDISDSSGSTIYRDHDPGSSTGLSEPKKLLGEARLTTVQTETPSEHAINVSVNQSESSRLSEPEDENDLSDQKSPDQVDIDILEEYNVTIAHEANDKDIDEEMVVDICEGDSDTRKSLEMTLTCNNAGVSADASAPLNGISSEVSYAAKEINPSQLNDSAMKVYSSQASDTIGKVHSSQVSDTAINVNSSQQFTSTAASHPSVSSIPSSKGKHELLTIIRDPSQIRHKNSQHIAASQSVLPQNSVVLATNSYPAQTMKAAKPVSILTNTNISLDSLQGTVKVAPPTSHKVSSSSSNEMLTVMSPSLLTQTSVGKPPNSSTSQLATSSTHPQSLLSQSVVISALPHLNKSNSDSAINHSMLASPHSNSAPVVSSASQISAPKTQANMLSLLASQLASTQQSANQASAIPSGVQKMIILRPGSPSIVTKKTIPASIVQTVVNTDTKITSTQQISNTPRQVSLLTGQIVRQQTPPRTVSQTTPTNKKAAISLITGNQTVSSQAPNQTTLNKLTNPARAANSKTANQVILLNSLKQPQGVSLINPVPNLLTSTNQITDVNGQMIVNQKPQPVTLSLLNSGVVKQVSLLQNFTTSQNFGNPQSHKLVTGANNSNLILHLPGNSHDNSNPDSKMSAIGITKHGKNYSRSQATPDCRMSTDEERKKSQYDILRAWKKNPELYRRNPSKSKKTVLAAKDRIEGEVDVILPLHLEDYTRLEALVKAAVKRHPLIQAGVNKLTHPYCAESLEQWNTWPIGKQRASEWHRACFVNKYLKMCLGNKEDFHGEPLMTTRQLVHWCRQHAFSPCLFVKTDKSKEEDNLQSLPAQQNISHHPSFTPVIELETQLATTPPTTTPNSDDVDMEVDILRDEPVTNKIPVKEIKKETEMKDCDNPSWLIPSDGAIFVHDELRKRGIKIQPGELEPGVMAYTAAEMLFQAMREFSADILREALASRAKSQNSTSVGLARHDVHKAITNLPEAVFCCDKFMGKEDEEQDSGGR